MGKSKAPPPRDYYGETADTLNAQVNLAPKLYDVESQFSPLYTQLDLKNLDTMLTGTPASTTTQNVTADRAGWYDASGKLVSENQKQFNGMGLNGRATVEIPDGYRWLNKGAVIGTRQVNAPAQRGMLDIYEQTLMPAYDRMTSNSQRAQLEGDMRAMQTYGPLVGQAMRQTQGNEELMAELNRQALSELQAGASLDPSLRREVQQNIRAGQAARGFGYGLNDLASEASLTAMQAEQLRRNRQGFAMGLAGLNQQVSGDPFMAVLGRPVASTALGQNSGQFATSMAKNLGPTIFNPESQYSADINNQAYQAQASINAAKAAGQGQMIGAGIGAVGTVAAVLL
jgi:hypothetical protein